MKINLNKKYTTVAFYFCIVILFSIVCVYFVINPDKLSSIFSSVWAIISPIVGGAILAYIICPVMNFFERKVFIPKECRIARKKAKEQAIASRITNKNKLEKIMFEASEKVKAQKHLAKLNADKRKKQKSFIDRVRLLRHGKLHFGNRALSLICTYILLIAIVSAVVSVIIPQIFNSITDLYQNVRNIVMSLPEHVAMLSQKYEWFDEVYQMVLERFSLDEIRSLLEGLLANSMNYIKIVTNLVTSVVVQVKNVVLIIIFSVYFLIYKELLGKQFNKLLDAIVKPKKATYVRHIFKEFDVRFGQYLQGQILDSFFVGLISFIVFGLFGIPYYQLIAVVVGITNIIPVFGPFIGAIPSAIIILIADPSKLIIFILLVLVMQQIDGNIIVPRILGTTVGLKPVWIIVAITVMGGLFGFFGMFFGVPIFAVIYTLISEAIHKRLAIKAATQVVAETESVDFVKFLSDQDEHVNAQQQAEGTDPA